MLSCDWLCLHSGGALSRSTAAPPPLQPIAGATRHTTLRSQRTLALAAPIDVCPKALSNIHFENPPSSTRLGTQACWGCSSRRFISGSISFRCYDFPLHKRRIVDSLNVFQTTRPARGLRKISRPVNKPIGTSHLKTKLRNGYGIYTSREHAFTSKIARV
ncbi:hypothetical protein AG1IA_01265 [Rhizoctonia solani AG-1 IA]|uniref:Uncharacterized protein n=1 Tax=Thanatephorus cucumeris (strain AG1-IA) TaxID=983506 RepID=L8X307_THACA|nr:hypothetical protein AG1IA_01265 [Rhizoctonia solani AG-1 IA]